MRFSNEQQPTIVPEPPGLSQEKTREYRVRHFYQMLKLTLYTDQGVRQEWISPTTELGQETWQHFFQTELAQADELGLTEIREEVANFWKQYLFGEMEQDRTLGVRGEATSALVDKVRQVLLTTISFNLEQAFPDQGFLVTALRYYRDIFRAHYDQRASLFVVDARYNTAELNESNEWTWLEGLAPLISVTGVFTIDNLTQILRADQAMRIARRRRGGRITGTARRLTSESTSGQQDSQVSFPFPYQSGSSPAVASSTPEYDIRDRILEMLPDPNEDIRDNQN